MSKNVVARGAKKVTERVVPSVSQRASQSVSQRASQSVSQKVSEPKMTQKKIPLKNIDKIMKRVKHIYENYICIKFSESTRKAIMEKLDDYDIIFYKAFTSSLEDPENNYESLEKVGDAVLKSAFITYLYETNIEMGLHLGEDGINNYTAKYLGKTTLSKIGDFLDFRSIINTPLGVSVSIFEDTVEAFIAAIHLVGSSIHPGLGYSCAKIFTDHIFRNVVKLRFDTEEYLESSPPNTWIKNIRDIFKFDVISTKTTKGQFIVRVSDEMVQLINDYNSALGYNEKLKVEHPIGYADIIIIDNDKISKDAAEEKAMIMARKWFNDNGIDDEMIEKLRFMDFLNKNEGLNKYIREIIMKMKSENLISLKIKDEVDHFNKESRFMLNLIGIRKNENKTVPLLFVKEIVLSEVVLGNKSDRETFKRSKVDLIKKWLNRE